MRVRAFPLRLSASASGLGSHRHPPPPNNSFKPTPCRGIGRVLYATLAHVRRPATGRLNSGVSTHMNEVASQEQQGPSFFVYIIESPAPVDLYHRRGEGDLLRQAVELNLISCTLRLAINLEAFQASLSIGLSEAMQSTPNSIPILHISAHGYAHGIQLSSGEILEWHQLRELLIPVNEAFNGNLVVCMSTCEGYSGQRMAMVPDSTNHPFLAIIGNGSKPTWPETAVAFASFYHLLANGRNIEDAVNAMCVASGNSEFFLTTAEQSKQSYISYIKEMEASEVKEELDEQIEATGDNPLAKLLRAAG